MHAVTWRLIPQEQEITKNNNDFHLSSAMNKISMHLSAQWATPVEIVEAISTRLQKFGVITKESFQTYTH